MTACPHPAGSLVADRPGWVRCGACGRRLTDEQLRRRASTRMQRIWRTVARVRRF